jgi:hypothetical protein
MKRVAIAILGFAILSVTCIGFTLLLHRTGLSLDGEMEQITAAVAADDLARAQASYQSLCRRWRQSEPLWLFLTGRKHVGAIPPYLARIEEYLRQQKSSDLLVELSELRAYFEHIWDTHALSLENLL